MARLRDLIIALVISSLPLMTGCGGSVSANSTTGAAPLEIVTSAVPDGTLGRTYSAQLVASGGVSPYSWHLTSGTLPPGLSLSSSGLISGTPSAQAEDSVEIEVTDSAVTTSGANGTTGSGSNSKSKGIKVRTLKPLAVTTTSLPTATVGSAYSNTLQATGGLTPYKWVLTAGQLPPGLALNASTGTISGTPSAAGSFNFTADVSDSASPSSSTAAPLTLPTNPTPTKVSVTTTSLPDAAVGTSYTVTLQAAGGTPPYTWSVSSGSLPTGLTLDAGTGILSGTPSSAGNFSIGLGVRDSVGASATSNLSLKIAAAALTIMTATLPNGTVGVPYDTTLSASGGTPPYTWSIASGQLPPSLIMVATTGEIYGTPSTAGDYAFTAQVQDNAQNPAVTAKSSNVSISSSTGLDQYGGRTDIPGAAAKGYFYVGEVNNRATLVDPLGNYFPFKSLEQVSRNYGDDPVGTKYATATEFYTQSARRLKSWGFNVIGPVSDSFAWPVGSYWDTHVSYISASDAYVPFVMGNGNPAITGLLDGSFKDITYGTTLVTYNGWRYGGGYASGSNPDVRDPGFATKANALMTAMNDKTITYANAPGEAAGACFATEPHTCIDNSPWLIGFYLDDFDHLNAWRGSNNTPNGGWLIAVTSPLQSGNVTVSKTYSDRTVYAKKAWHNYIAAKYGTNPGAAGGTSGKALNAEWGSNYTTLLTSGTCYGSLQPSWLCPSPSPAVTMTDSGTHLTYTATLSGTVSKYSVYVADGSTTIGGDVANDFKNYVMYGTGCGGMTGTINYSTGAVTITCTTRPSNIPTIGYIKNGYGIGTGLMDENCVLGQAWFGADNCGSYGGMNMASANANLRADLNAELASEIDAYFATAVAAVKTVAPHHLVVAPIGASGLTPSYYWTEAGKYVDFADIAVDPHYIPVGSTLADTLVAAYSSFQKPLYVSSSLMAQADSPMPYPGGMAGYEDDNFATQEARAVQLYKQVSTAYNLANGGKYFVIGWDWYQWTDFSAGQINSGVVTNKDNAYDGVEDKIATGTDAWGYPVGGESANHGNFITTRTGCPVGVAECGVRAANALWLSRQ